VHRAELTVFILSPSENVCFTLENFIKAPLLLARGQILTAVSNNQYVLMAGDKALDENPRIYNFGIGVAATAMLSIAHSSVPRRILK